MQKVRTERGITLIALIITIIVMLILVGVTVSVSLNGGLFTTAKQATGQTQLELDKEQLLELALGAMDKEGNVSSTEITKYGTFTYANGVYTSVKSGNKFTVSKWGSVAEVPETQVYTVSGEWKFKDDLTPYSGEAEGIYISQDISFEALYYEEGSYSIVQYDNITYSFADYSGGAEPTWPSLSLLRKNDYGCLTYEGLEGGWLEDLGWYGEVPSNMKYNSFRFVDFGSEPQEVSEEFYEWFTANATQVQ